MLGQEEGMLQAAATLYYHWDQAEQHFPHERDFRFSFTGMKWISKHLTGITTL